MTPAPDFRLYHGNALDVLAGLLADALRTDVPGQSLLAPDTILIPQVAMRRWLQATLAARHGIAANLEFLTPGEFVARALDANLGASQDDLDLDTLQWRLHAALSDPALRRKPAMAQLAAYLAEDNGHPDPLKSWSLAGELALASGTLDVFGNPRPRSARALLAMRKGLGVLLQGNGLLTDLTVAENVALPLRTHTRLPEPVLQALVRMKLHAVGLRAAADAWPRELSGGMARRVALARALALDPPLMLYDEPLTGLDPIASGVITALIQRLNRSLGLTSIIVSHHVRETLPICDQAVVIANGRIVFVGTPDTLQASTDPLLRQFLDGQPDGPIPFDARAIDAHAKDAA